MLYKRLPVAEYAHLADLLFHEYGLRGVLIGGLEEQELHEELQSLAPDSLSIAPVGDFQRLADMIGLALFYIGGDSGLMHTSAALGKRCIAFFGPSDESRTGPFFAGYPPDRHLILRRDDLACAPCFKIDLAGKYPECVHGDARCLTKFPMESVWNRISGFVSEILKTEEVRGEVAQRYL
jgi:ADP-heptose:LPS heptosyltransferase